MVVGLGGGSEDTWSMRNESEEWRDSFLVSRADWHCSWVSIWVWMAVKRFWMALRMSSSSLDCGLGGMEKSMKAPMLGTCYSFAKR